MLFVASRMKKRVKQKRDSITKKINFSPKESQQIKGAFNNAIVNLSRHLSIDSTLMEKQTIKKPPVESKGMIETKDNNK